MKTSINANLNILRGQTMKCKSSAKIPYKYIQMILSYFDYIIMIEMLLNIGINNQPTKDLTHAEAQNIFK